MAIVIHAAEAVLPSGLTADVYLTIDGDRITRIDTTPPPNGTPIHHTPLLLPGFVDIHNHGLGGAPDTIDNWLKPDFSLKLLPSGGTTSLLASVIPISPEHLRRLMDALTPVFDQPGHGAVLAGIHAEGPLIADLGALPQMEASAQSPAFDEMLDILGRRLKVMTIAPAVDANVAYAGIRKLVQRQVRPALGHDRNCSLTDILGALQAIKDAADGGAADDQRAHITHLFNVCSFNHRTPSLVNVGLCPKLPKLSEQPEPGDLPSPTVEVILDGAHVHLLTVAGLLAARTPSDIVCITDSILHATPGATAKYCGREVEVNANASFVCLRGTSTLAGGCLPLWEAFKLLTTTLGVSVADASTMLSAAPARIARLPDVGELRVGAFADLLCVSRDESASELQLQQTFVRGQKVWSRE